jgi:hypothetical protein
MAAAVVAVVALAVGGYFYFPRAPKLTDRDTIVLADFVNTTGEENYYRFVIWDLEKVAQFDEVWQKTYPQDVEPYHELGFRRWTKRGRQYAWSRTTRRTCRTSVFPIAGSTAWTRRP